MTTAAPDAVAAAAGCFKVMLGSQVTRSDANGVALDDRGEPRRLENDYVIVCAGGVLPTPMLKDIGSRIETTFGSE